MGEGIISTFFIALVIGIVLAFLIARSFQNIAEMKGHNGGAYFWWTFFLPPVGMMMVIALPDRNMTVSISEEAMRKISESVKTPAPASAYTYAPSSDELPNL